MVDYKIILLIIIIILFFILCYLIINNEHKRKLKQLKEQYFEKNFKYVQNEYKIRNDLKNIFCFWDTKELPIFINECLKNIKNRLPEWNLILLNNDTVYNLIDKKIFPKNFDKIHIQGKSDWIRLYLLNTYGGLWLDASIVINDPQEIENMYNILINNDVNLITYTLDKHSVIINNKKNYCVENWFLFSKPNSIILKNWLKEFEYAIDIGFNKYKKNISCDSKNYLLPKTEINNEIYFTAYKCYLISIQKNKADINKIFFKSAENTMYKYHIMYKWKRELYINYLLKNKVKENIKFISYDRNYFENNIDILKKFIKIYFNVYI